jgi:hypothetical protein
MSILLGGADFVAARSANGEEADIHAHHQKYDGARRPLHWGFPERVRGEHLIAAMQFASLMKPQAKKNWPRKN